MYIPLWLLVVLGFSWFVCLLSDLFGGPSAKEIRRQAYAEIESRLANFSRWRLPFNEYDKSDLAKLKAFRGRAWDSTRCEDRSQAPPAALGLLLALCLAGCAAHSGVVPMGPDRFLVSRQAATGFSGTGTLKADALREAYAYCLDQHKQLHVLQTLEAQPPYVLGNFPKAEVQFRCLTADQAVAP